MYKNIELTDLFKNIPKNMANKKHEFMARINNSAIFSIDIDKIDPMERFAKNPSNHDSVIMLPFDKCIFNAQTKTETQETHALIYFCSQNKTTLEIEITSCIAGKNIESLFLSTVVFNNRLEESDINDW